jgi:hypothetical protein
MQQHFMKCLRLFRVERWERKNMKLLVVIMFALVPLAFADDMTWEIAPSGLPEIPYLTEEGNQATETGVDNGVDIYPEPQEHQENPYQLLPLINFQPCPDPCYGEPAQKADYNAEQLKVQRGANALAKEANRLQSIYVFLTGCLVVIGLGIGGMQIWLMFNQTNIAENAATAARDSAKATEISAEATKDGVKAAQASAEATKIIVLVVYRGFNVC